jgi:tryptophanyl-tRNA synthetase
VDSPLGTILMLDADADIARKVKRAVTDTDGEVRYDPEGKPGVSNLLELLAVATGQSPAALAGTYRGYGDLKDDLTQALIELLRPVRERRAELDQDPGAVSALLALGAEKARVTASATYRRAAAAMGLLIPD